MQRIENKLNYYGICLNGEGLKDPSGIFDSVYFLLSIFLPLIRFGHCLTYPIATHALLKNITGLFKIGLIA